MANGNKPDFNVFISEKGKDDKIYYHRVGAAWNVSNDGISIRLTALPIDGNLILFPPRENDN